MRIFLDANILFSAAKSAGAVRELLALLDADGHRLCADAFVMGEAQRNLQAKAAEALPVLTAIGARIEVAAYHPSALPPDLAALLPEKDRPVLAAALRAKCDALLTGDRTPFGGLYGREVRGMAVHSPRSLAETLGLQRRS